MRVAAWKSSGFVRIQSRISLVLCVAEYQMHIKVGRHRRLDLVEEAVELAGAVTRVNRPGFPGGSN
jgi:hypothetical protein